MIAALMMSLALPDTPAARAASAITAAIDVWKAAVTSKLSSRVGSSSTSTSTVMTPSGLSGEPDAPEGDVRRRRSTSPPEEAVVTLKTYPRTPVLIGGTERDPFPSDGPGFHKVTMADFFTDHARRHRASFIHARVALFPGQLDRLW